MGEALAAYLSSSGLAARLRDEPVFRAWREAAGERLAARARAVRFADGALVVEVSSAPHLHELTSFTGEAYRRAANQRLGEERIRRVTFLLKR